MKKTLSGLFALILCMVFGFGCVGASAEAVFEYDIDQIYNLMTEAYIGQFSDESGYVGFGANDDGSFAMLFMYWEDGHVSFVGEAVVDQANNTVTIADEASGMQITFGVTTDGEAIIIDTEEIGEVELYAVSVDELVGLFIDVLENIPTIESVA